MRSLLTLLYIALLVSALRAQDAAPKPDFSGRWVLVEPTETPDIPYQLEVSRSLERAGDVLLVERHFRSGVRSDRHTIGVISGTVGGLPGRIENRSTGSVTWKADVLVFDLASYSGPQRDSGPYSEHTETWRLDGSGHLVIEVIDESTGSPRRTTTLTYRRP